MVRYRRSLDMDEVISNEGFSLFPGNWWGRTEKGSDGRYPTTDFETCDAKVISIKRCSDAAVL